MRCKECGREDKRSASQNSIGHAWYGELAKRYPQDTAIGWKCYCKLHFGVPILRADDQDPTFRDFYDKHIKHLPYETKLEYMIHLPVTSIMNKTQESQYLEAMNKEWPFLKFPGDI